MGISIRFRIHAISYVDDKVGRNRNRGNWEYERIEIGIEHACDRDRNM